MTTETKMTKATNNLHGNNKMMDLSEPFGSEASNEAACRPTQSLQRVRLSETPTVIAPVTTAVEVANFHYMDTEAVRGYISCNGDDCVLCRAGIKKDVRLLMPVLNILEQRMEILPISKAEKPTSLLPQLKPLLGTAGQLITIIQKGMAFQVSSQPMPEGVALDKGVIEAFQIKHDQGELRFSDIYQVMANEELAEIPQVKTRLLIQQAS